MSFSPSVSHETHPAVQPSEVHQKEVNMQFLHIQNDPHPEIKRERLKMEEEERHLQRERDQRDLEARIRNEQN